jgi:UDP-N-acetylglucosamine:LPS N-acetylglucosamine transferase
MSNDTLDPKFLAEHVVKAKAAWRAHAQQLSWEEKVAAIERMWERDRLLKESREAGADMPT